MTTSGSRGEMDRLAVPLANGSGDALGPCTQVSPGITEKEGCFCLENTIGDLDLDLMASQSGCCSRSSSARRSVQTLLTGLTRSRRQWGGLRRRAASARGTRYCPSEGRVPQRGGRRQQQSGARRKPEPAHTPRSLPKTCISLTLVALEAGS